MMVKDLSLGTTHRGKILEGGRHGKKWRRFDTCSADFGGLIMSSHIGGSIDDDDDDDDEFSRCFTCLEHM